MKSSDLIIKQTLFGTYVAKFGEVAFGHSVNGWLTGVRTISANDLLEYRRLQGEVQAAKARLEQHCLQAYERGKAVRAKQL